MLTTSRSGNTFKCYDYIEIKCTKNIKNCFESKINVNVTKRDGSQHSPSDRRQFVLTSAVNGNV